MLNVVVLNVVMLNVVMLNVVVLSVVAPESNLGSSELEAMTQPPRYAHPRQSQRFHLVAGVQPRPCQNKVGLIKLKAP